MEIASSKTIARLKNFQTTIFSSAALESRDIKMDAKRGNKGRSKNFIFECNARWCIRDGASRYIDGVKNCELLGLSTDLEYSECNEFLIKRSITGI